MNNDHFAVIVTYHHSPLELNNLLSSLEDLNVVIVNNSNDYINCKSNITVIQNNGNLGLATALNQGIIYCLSRNPKTITLFDQDTIITSQNIKLMISEAISLFSDHTTAAIGPSFYEKNSDKLHGFAVLNKFGVVVKRSQRKYTCALYLITSGTVLNPALLNKIGLMEEKLFIDYIDVEWGLRANQMGYKVIGLNDIVMDHVVGDNSVSIFGKKIPIHSNIRLYYQTRNSIYLMLYKNLPLKWKLSDAIYFFKRSLFYILLNYKNIKIITKGIINGIKFQ